MKRILLLITILISVSSWIYAQQSNDSLYLKNGSSLSGKLIEVANDQYMIKTSEGFLFTFSGDEVEKFVLGSRPGPNEVKIFNPNGPGFGIESGLLLGSPGVHFFILASLNLMFTYTFHSRNTILIGAGTEMFDEFYLPLFTEYRFNLLHRDVSPFIYLRGGGLIPFGNNEGNTDYNGGWTLGGGTGFRWPIAGFESFIRVGFRYSYTSSTVKYYSSPPAQTDYEYRHNFYRLELKWGFTF